ncbi:MAG: hypothetical protein LC108_04660 [Anaerolineales bacterium]|nr:hypothetical protein [Anaerolineales bacterium]
MKNLKILSGILIALLLILACGTTAPTQAVPALPTMTMPLADASQLKSSPLNEESSAPVYKITAQIPYIEGVNDQRVLDFNSALKAIVESEIEAFKGGMAEMPTETIVLAVPNIVYELIASGKYLEMSNGMATLTARRTRIITV